MRLLMQKYDQFNYLKIKKINTWSCFKKISSKFSSSKILLQSLEMIGTFFGLLGYFIKREFCLKRYLAY
jgi:hypothetical protein